MTARTSKGQTPAEPRKPEPEKNPIIDHNSKLEEVQTGWTDKGQVWAVSDRFSVGGSLNPIGIQLVGISSRNHVGPASLVIVLDELDELVEVLQGAQKQLKKDAPEPDEAA